MSEGLASSLVKLFFMGKAKKFFKELLYQQSSLTTIIFMERSIFFLLVLLLNSEFSRAQFPGWAWVRQVNQVFETRHKIDRSGNLYQYYGYLNSTVKFGSHSGDTITVQNSDNTGGSADIVIAKYDSEANIKWAVSYGLPQGDEFITDLDVDSDGNVYIVGFYRGLYTKFGNTVLNNPAFGSNCFDVGANYGSDNWMFGSPLAGYKPVAYRAKISPQGNLLWVKNNIIGSGVDSVNFSSKAVRLAVSPEGYSYVYIVGSQGTAFGNPYAGLNFGNNVVIPNDSVVNTSPGYLAYFNPNGDAIWAKGIDLPIASELSPLSMRAVAPDGGLVYSYSRDTLGANHTITSLIKISNTGANIFSTVLFDEHAVVQTPYTYAGNFMFNNRIDFDEQGNIYVGGSKLFPSTPSLATDLTFFKLNNNGVLISTFQVPSDGDFDVLFDFTVTGIDTICFAGTFNGQFVQLGSEILFNSNGTGQIQDTYFARYRSGGYDWQTIISPQGDLVGGMESDAYDNIYVRLLTNDVSGTYSNVNYTCNIENFYCNHYGKIGNQTGLSVSEYSTKKIVLYPNPVRGGTFYVAGLDDEKMNIYIYDSQGRVILLKENISNDSQIQTELSSGYYLIEISTISKMIYRLPLIVY